MSELVPTMYGLGGVASGFLLARPFRSAAHRWTAGAAEAGRVSRVVVVLPLLTLALIFLAALVLWPVSLAGLQYRRLRESRRAEIGDLLEYERLREELSQDGGG